MIAIFNLDFEYFEFVFIYLYKFLQTFAECAEAGGMRMSINITGTNEHEHGMFIDLISIKCIHGWIHYNRLPPPTSHTSNVT